MRGHRNRLWLLGVVLSSLILFVCSTSVARAAPVPPLRVVNHETKECAEIFGGDECMDCFPPEGWEIIGYVYDEDCPDGYTEVNNGPGYTCEPFKEQFCCTEGHSGAHGDCVDMVVNRRRKECAFVSDITAVDVPGGWRQKPERTSSYDWACPYNYDWVEGIEEKPLSGNGSQGELFGVPCSSFGSLVGTSILVYILKSRHGNRPDRFPPQSST